jgi:hypothetical protein
VSQTFSIPFPTTPETVHWMAHFARTGAKDQRVRGLAEQIVRGITPKDYLAEALAVGRWVEVHVRYLRDTTSVELVQHPAHTIEAGAGDCDDMATLIGALLLSIGHKVAFVTVAFANGQWSHVFAQIYDPKSGQWVVIDPVAQPDVKGMLRRVRKYRIYPV